MSRTTHIAIDARYLSQPALGAGFHTYLLQLLLTLHKLYNGTKNKTRKGITYHFHLWLQEPLPTQLKKNFPASAFSLRYIAAPRNLVGEQKKRYFLKNFCHDASMHAFPLAIAFFPHFELPKKSELALLRKNNVKIIVTIHDIIALYFILPRTLLSKHFLWKGLNSRGILYYLLLKFQIYAWDRILTVSKASAHQLLAMLPSPSRRHARALPGVTVTPLGCAAHFKPISAAGCRRFLKTHEQHSLTYKRYLLYFGGHSVRKNLTRASLAFLKVLAHFNEFSSYQLVMVGGEWLVQQLFTSTRLKKQLPTTAAKAIVSLGRLRDKELGYWVAGARFTLHPSLIEGFDLPVLESIRAHTLPICSDIPVHRELVGPDLPCFNPTRLAALERTLTYFLNLQQTEEKRLLRPLLQRTKKFTWEHNARLTHQAWQATLN